VSSVASPPPVSLNAPPLLAPPVSAEEPPLLALPIGPVPGPPSELLSLPDPPPQRTESSATPASDTASVLESDRFFMESTFFPLAADSRALEQCAPIRACCQGAGRAYHARSTR
jgi:hypothetical protein